MDFDYITMGHRIKLRRKELNLTQAVLAERLNVSQNHVSAIECGSQHPSFECFISICDILHVNPDYLIMDAHILPTPLFRFWIVSIYVIVLQLNLPKDSQNF